MPIKERYAGPPTNNIGRLRSKLGMTQQDLADRIGLSQGIVSRAERGDSSLDTKRKIATALGQDIVDVFPRLQEYTVRCARCQRTSLGVPLNLIGGSSYEGLCWSCCMEFKTHELLSTQKFIHGRYGRRYTTQQIRDILTFAENFSDELPALKLNRTHRVTVRAVKHNQIGAVTILSKAVC